MNNQLSNNLYHSDNNSNSNEKVLKGYTLPKCRFIPTVDKPVLLFRHAETGEIIGIDEKSLYKNILLTGAAGTGKTNVINQIFYQVRSQSSCNDGVYIVFDTKADYYHHRNFFRPNDVCIGNSRYFRDKSAVWNIFSEVLADGDDPADYEANAKEISRVLFEGRGSVTQPFFAQAACDIFATALIYMVRRSKVNQTAWAGKLNNSFLKQFLLSNTPAKLKEYFYIYPDMRSIITYFDDDAKGQAQSVLSELYQMINDCFQGVFAKESKDNRYFSMRQLVRGKNERAIFIEYDMSVGEIMTPMYRLLVDLALKEAVNERAQGRVHLFLDELKLLPKLSHLNDALNFGRSKNISVVAGIQNVNQLYTTYGESGAKEILEGFSNIIAFKANDHATREYISKRFGTNLIAYRYYSTGKEPIDRERDGYTVEEWHQINLKTGQAIVGLATQPQPFVFFFEKDT